MSHRSVEGAALVTSAGLTPVLSAQHEEECGEDGDVFHASENISVV